MIVMALASGTSADGIDVGVVDLRWGPRSDISLRLLTADCRPWPGRLGEELLNLLPPRTTTAAEVCRLDSAVGRAIADAARHAIDTGAADGVGLIVSPRARPTAWG